MTDQRGEHPDRQFLFLQELVAEHATISGDIIEVGTHTWAIHGSIAVDGDVIMAEYDTPDQARLALGKLSPADPKPMPHDESTGPSPDPVEPRLPHALHLQKGEEVKIVSRGFEGRRRQPGDGLVPPGQYLVEDFPVLTAGPTPFTPRRIGTSRSSTRQGPWLRAGPGTSSEGCPPRRRPSTSTV